MFQCDVGLLSSRSRCCTIDPRRAGPREGGREGSVCVCVCVHVESVWLEVKWSALTAKKGLFEGRGESSLTAAGELDRTLEWKQSDPESIDNLLRHL